MSAFDEGLTIRQAGEYIDRVETQEALVELIGSGSGTEIMNLSVRTGQQFALAPDPNWDGTEFVYVLTGCLQREPVKDEEGPCAFGVGDLLVVRNFSKPISLIAREPTNLLYITSAPWFHSLSGEIKELHRLAVEIEEKDGYTSDHCRRIQQYASRVGRVLSLDPLRLHHLMYGALFHDIGKARVPLEILGKPGPLTPDEWTIMKKHPTLGRAIVEDAKMPDLREAAPIIEQHHERIDGSGYPKGLKGSDVMVEAQIVAVVDTFDAMTTDRPYRKALPREEAVREIESLAGTWFEPSVVRAFLSVIAADDIGFDATDV